MEWKPPENMKPIAEYWLPNINPHVITIFEADSYAAIMAANMPWADIFDYSVFPAVTGEEGLKIAQQMMSKT